MELISASLSPRAILGEGNRQALISGGMGATRYNCGMGIKAFGRAVTEAGKSWNEASSSRLAAALAFYAMLSMAPLLLIAISIAGLIFGEAAARNEMAIRLEEHLGAAPAQVLQQAIASAADVGNNIWAITIGVGILILTATRMFAELQSDLNMIWGVKSRGGVLSIARKRLLSFLMILIVAALLMALIFLSAGLSAVHAYAQDYLPGSPVLWRIADAIISLVVITLLFMAIYKWLPDVMICWHDLWFGSLTTAVLFTIGKFLIGMYLGRSSPGSAYGAAGSLVVLLLWVYYSAMIFLYGAHFTRAYATHRGAQIRPNNNAVWIEGRE